MNDPRDWFLEDVLKKLDVINVKLNIILLMERYDMADEAALDQAISDLSTQLDDLQSAAQSIVDKVSNMPDAPDLSDEISTIQGFGSRITSTTDSLKAAAETGTTTGDTTAEVPPPEETV
jgi:hypothetical protein